MASGVLMNCGSAQLTPLPAQPNGRSSVQPAPSAWPWDAASSISTSISDSAAAAHPASHSGSESNTGIREAIDFACVPRAISRTFDPIGYLLPRRIRLVSTNIVGEHESCQSLHRRVLMHRAVDVRGSAMCRVVTG
jgi:hypothetical protein